MRLNVVMTASPTFVLGEFVMGSTVAQNKRKARKTVKSGSLFASYVYFVVHARYSSIVGAL